MKLEIWKEQWDMMKPIEIESFRIFCSFNISRFIKTTLMWNHRSDDKSYEFWRFLDIQLWTFITWSRLPFKKSYPLNHCDPWILLNTDKDHGPCLNFHLWLFFVLFLTNCSSIYQEQFRNILCFDASYFFQHPSNFHLLHAGFVWPWLIWRGDQPIWVLASFLPVEGQLRNDVERDIQCLRESCQRIHTWDDRIWEVSYVMVYGKPM